MTLHMWQVVVISQKWSIELLGLWLGLGQWVSASLNPHYKFQPLYIALLVNVAYEFRNCRIAQHSGWSKYRLQRSALGSTQRVGSAKVKK